MPRLALILSLLLCCIGCNRVARPALFPESVGGEAELAFLNQLKADEAGVSSFKGLARGVLQDGKERAIIRYVILFKKPSDLRIEALPATGAYTLSVLAANKAGVTLIDPVGERAYHAVDPSQAIKTALKIPVAPDELTSYLLGEVPAKFLDPALTMRRSAAGVQLIQGDFAAYWLLDSKTNRLKSVELRRSPRSAPILTITYGDYAESGKFRYPKDFTIDVPRESVHGTITFKSAEFNPALWDSSFAIEIPEGYKVYEGLDRPAE